jgi:hypothetical protein
VPPIHRKSAMRVRDGRVRKKNNWNPDPGDYYARPQAEIRIERDPPGPGYRHVVTVRQLRDFLDLLPDWEELAIGLEAIALTSGRDDWLGLSNPGVVVITAWERDLWWDNAHRNWIEENSDVLDLLNVERLAHGQTQDWFELRWTEPQARAFLLLDVLVHELGHHHDRMTTAGSAAPRGEPFAHAYATRVRGEIWLEYVERFGI